MSPNVDMQDENSLAQAVGIRLRQVAEFEGFNSRRLAMAVGLSPQTLGKYWNGNRLIPANFLFLIADVIKVNPRWLITGEGERRPEFNANFVDKAGEEELLWQYRTIPDAHRLALMNIAKALAEANGIALGPTRQSATNAFQAQSQSRTLHSPVTEYLPQPKDQDL